MSIAVEAVVTSNQTTVLSDTATRWQRYCHVKALSLKGSQILSSYRENQDQDSDPFLNVNESRFCMQERIEVAEKLIKFLHDDNCRVRKHAHRSLKLLMCTDRICSATIWKSVIASAKSI
jgi:hypothetical protein